MNRKDKSIYIKEDGKTRKIVEKELNNRGIQLYRYASIDALKDVEPIKMTDRYYTEIDGMLNQLSKDDYEIYTDLIELLMNKIANLKSTNELFLDDDSILNMIVRVHLNNKRKVESTKKHSRYKQYSRITRELVDTIKDNNGLSIMDGIVKSIIKRYTRLQIDKLDDYEITNIHRFIIDGEDPLNFININNEPAINIEDESLKTILRGIIIVLINNKYEAKTTHLCFDCKYPMKDCPKMMLPWTTINKYDFITDGRQVTHEGDYTQSWFDSEGKLCEETKHGEIIDKFVVSKCKNYIK